MLKKLLSNRKFFSGAYGLALLCLGAGVVLSFVFQFSGNLSILSFSLILYVLGFFISSGTEVLKFFQLQILTKEVLIETEGGELKDVELEDEPKVINEKLGEEGSKVSNKDKNDIYKTEKLWSLSKSVLFALIAVFTLVVVCLL